MSSIPTQPRPGRPRANALLAGLLTLALYTAPIPALAAEIEEVPFPETVEAGSHRLPLFGLGLLRYRLVFRGYVGGLYLPAGARAELALEDVPKALELYYFWDIQGRFFGQAAEELLARSMPPERMARLRPRLERLHALYRDVEAGDRYRLSYSPDEGTTLSLNGQPLGTIPGADFARAYFGIWLGARPIDETFRNQILEGGAAGISSTPWARSGSKS